ncbi:SAF domain protein [Beutenbergia cavernae DSM 12333]|uniref:SAF domain protein n=1 Tax=Beutenbergia cavernae (strain ATCC BAA-8 / DSM 12333 / CCUG 43141 / JCM 11478 / NBRC 16432 / NCIMB 13614 / HKI 0122) TaxID=471853 RepID=C5BZJ0_BEUC1|nr:SAF domain protein [Beutenbergia cavernae DSM 12333]
MRVALWRARHVVAALALAVAATMALATLRPPDPPSVDVLVAAHDIAAAQEIVPADVRVVALPADAVPPDALDAADDVVGRQLAHALPAGYPLGPGMVLGPGLADGAPRGTTVVPVRFADPLLTSVLEPGATVDLVAAGDQEAGAHVLATDAVVLARVDGEAGGGIGGLTSSAPDAPLLLVAVRPDVATLVVEASARGTLTVVLVPSP